MWSSRSRSVPHRVTEQHDIDAVLGHMMRTGEPAMCPECRAGSLDVVSHDRLGAWTEATLTCTHCGFTLDLSAVAMRFGQDEDVHSP